jgi:choline transport protein
MSLDIDVAIPARLCMERDGTGVGVRWAGATSQAIRSPSPPPRVWSPYIQLLDMSEKANGKVTAQTSDGDAIAAREAREDERMKTEQQRTGGALEVIHPTRTRNVSLTSSKRYINAPSAVNFSFLLQCSWEAAAVTFQFSLANGGPASIAYGSIFAGIGTTLIAMSLAEMASMDPTVGAQYRWTAAFAPRCNKFFGLMQGWITTFAWICSCTSNAALMSNIIVSLASFNNAEYVPQRWHSTLIMWALTLCPFIGNFWLPKFINILETAGAICHVTFFFASIVTLAAMAQKSSARYVFQTLTHDASGWTNPAVAWGLGLLTVTYPLTGMLQSRRSLMCRSISATKQYNRI